MFSVIPRELSFFSFFDESAAVIVGAAEAYADLVNDYARRERHVGRIRQLEHDGDAIAHTALNKLNRTFVTPFDREDIQSLMKLMDDVVDEIDAASKRLTLYQIPEPTSWLIKQTDVLLTACKLVRQAVSRLRHLKKPNGLQECLVEIHRLENLGDDNNHAAAAELYNTATDPILAMKWKEIYDITERAIDCCEDVADLIAAIVLKNA